MPGPAQPRSPLARLLPSGPTADQRVEHLMRDALREHGMLVVRLSDPRLQWPDRELLRQIGERLYGVATRGEVR